MDSNKLASLPTNKQDDKLQISTEFDLEQEINASFISEWLRVFELEVPEEKP